MCKRVDVHSAMLASRVNILLLLLLLTGCATHESVTYKLYPGPNKQDSGIATLELYNASSAVIDGHHVNYGDYNTVKLLPGNHRIKWTSEHVVSVLIEPSGFAQRESQYEVILEEGHIYQLRSDRTTGPGYRIYHWVEDKTTGSVIAGTAKP